MRRKTTVVILERDWRTLPPSDLVAVRCPACSKVTKFKGRGQLFDWYMRNEHGFLVCSFNCGCLKDQRICLDNYHMRKHVNVGELK